MKDLYWKLLSLPILLSPTIFGASLNSYIQTNLVSDLPGIAANQDPDLVNPWGLAASGGSPFWVNDNGAGVSTLYNGSGIKQGLVVTVPSPTGTSGPSAPTGIIFNSASNAFAGASFIFDTENGTVSSWAGSNGTNAVLRATGAAGSVYKGLAGGLGAAGNLLYAANFGLGRVDVFDSNFNPTSVSGGFVDNNLPPGYAPFNVKNIGGNIYVSYALQDAAKHDDVSGAGHGFVDVFDTDGHLLQRLVSGGALNSPWGMTLATSNFGALSGDLLVGNFGDGHIDAYDPKTGAFLDTLNSTDGTPVDITGLWGLSFGNGAQGQGANSLFFTAGIPGPDNVEDHGLFGELNAAPEPGTWTLAAFGLAALALGARKRFRRAKCSPALDPSSLRGDLCR